MLIAKFFVLTLLLTFDSHAAPQILTAEGNDAKTIYAALTNVREPDCSDETCSAGAGTVDCRKLANDQHFCTLTRPDSDRMYALWEEQAQDLVKALGSLVNYQCDFYSCGLVIQNLNCIKSGPWYYHDYKCTLEQEVK